MRAFFLLAFIGLFGLVMAGDDSEVDSDANSGVDSVVRYTENFLENFHKDIDSIDAADKADIKNLGDAIFGLIDEIYRWDSDMVTQNDLAQGLIKFIEGKTGKKIDKQTVETVDHDLHEHVTDLCESILHRMETALDVLSRFPDFIYRNFSDDVVNEWTKIIQFCEEEFDKHDNYVSNIQQIILGDEAFPFEHQDYPNFSDDDDFLYDSHESEYLEDLEDSDDNSEAHS